MSINKDNPPADLPIHGEKWERGLDPWHRDAFPEEFKDAAPYQGKRREGWFLLDWVGNPVGFLPDDDE